MSVFSPWIIWEHLGLDFIETRLEESGNCSSPLLLLAFSMPLSATLCELSHGFLRILSFKPFSARVNSTTLVWESVVFWCDKTVKQYHLLPHILVLSSYGSLRAIVRDFSLVKVFTVTKKGDFDISVSNPKSVIITGFIFEIMIATNNLLIIIK